MAGWLPSVGIEYRWDERLGGRRRLAADAQNVDGWWRVESFRAYAAHTRSQDFADAMGDLLDAVSHGVTAVMCSESAWWRCHRRLIADVALLAHDVPVRHLMPVASRPTSPPRAPAPSDTVSWCGTESPTDLTPGR